MLLLRQLFDVAGGGPETDAFKHLAAAFTVLRSLGSAKTATNSESSRIVQFYSFSSFFFSLFFFFQSNPRGTIVKRSFLSRVILSRSRWRTVPCTERRYIVTFWTRLEWSDPYPTRRIITYFTKCWPACRTRNEVNFNFLLIYISCARLIHTRLASPVKLNLEGYNLKNLRYLQHGDTRQDEAEDAIRFQAWKACLGTWNS